MFTFDVKSNFKISSYLPLLTPPRLGESVTQLFLSEICKNLIIISTTLLILGQKLQLQKQLCYLKLVLVSNKNQIQSCKFKWWPLARVQK